MPRELYTDAVLTRDLAAHQLCAGDLVKIIDHHPVPGGEDGYTIEVFNTLGDTIAVTACPSRPWNRFAKRSVQRPTVRFRGMTPGAKTIAAAQRTGFIQPWCTLVNLPS